MKNPLFTFICVVAKDVLALNYVELCDSSIIFVMKLRRCTIILCSLLISLFISFSLILLSSINEENNLYQNYNRGNVSSVSGDV